MTTPELPINLLKKINAITKELEGQITKGGYNSNQKYKYVTEADVVNAVRPLLMANNLNLQIKELEAFQVREKLTQSSYEFVLIDLDSGETEATTISGQGLDGGDKGIYKSSTGAIKYFLMRRFLIATGDDPEKTDNKSAPTDDDESKPARRSSRLNRVK